MPINKNICTPSSLTASNFCYTKVEDILANIRNKNFCNTSQDPCFVSFENLRLPQATLLPQEIKENVVVLSNNQQNVSCSDLWGANITYDGQPISYINENGEDASNVIVEAGVFQTVLLNPSVEERDLAQKSLDDLAKTYAFNQLTCYIGNTSQTVYCDNCGANLYIADIDNPSILLNFPRTNPDYSSTILKDSNKQILSLDGLNSYLNLETPIPSYLEIDGSYINEKIDYVSQIKKEQNISAYIDAYSNLICSYTNNEFIKKCLPVADFSLNEDISNIIQLETTSNYVSVSPNTFTETLNIPSIYISEDEFKSDESDLKIEIDNKVQEGYSTVTTNLRNDLYTYAYNNLICTYSNKQIDQVYCDACNQTPLAFKTFRYPLYPSAANETLIYSTETDDCGSYYKIDNCTNYSSTIEEGTYVESTSGSDKDSLFDISKTAIENINNNIQNNITTFRNTCAYNSDPTYLFCDQTSAEEVADSTFGKQWKLPFILSVPNSIFDGSDTSYSNSFINVYLSSYTNENIQDGAPQYYLDGFTARIDQFIKQEYYDYVFNNILTYTFKEEDLLKSINIDGSGTIAEGYVFSWFIDDPDSLNEISGEYEREFLYAVSDIAADGSLILYKENASRLKTDRNIYSFTYNSKTYIRSDIFQAEEKLGQLKPRIYAEGMTFYIFRHNWWTEGIIKFDNSKGWYVFDNSARTDTYITEDYGGENIPKGDPSPESFTNRLVSETMSIKSFFMNYGSFSNTSKVLANLDALNSLTGTISCIYGNLPRDQLTCGSSLSQCGAENDWGYTSISPNVEQDKYYANTPSSSDTIAKAIQEASLLCVCNDDWGGGGGTSISISGGSVEATGEGCTECWVIF